MRHRPRVERWRALFPLLALLSGVACSGASGAGGAAGSQLGAAQVRVRPSADRPNLTLVEREGDPLKGAALAVHVADAPHAALALARLVEGRMQSLGFDTAGAHASPTGFIVHAFLAEEEDAARFVSAADRSLLAPLDARELERLTALWRMSPPPIASTDSAAAIARCSGELLLPPDASAALPSADEIEQRRAAIGAGDVTVAVVGTRPFLNAASQALTALVPWRNMGWSPLAPERADVIGAESAAVSEPTLSVAVWGIPAAAAVASAERLSADDSLLPIRLAGASPAWSVARVSSGLSRGGGCLRIDLRTNEPIASPNVIAAFIHAAAAEIEHTASRSDASRWDLDRQVLRLESPRQAAAAAAWHALNADVAPDRDDVRRLAHFTGRFAEPDGAEVLPSLVSKLEDSAGESRIEARHVVEGGQSGYWMLLGTPCGTRAEDSTTAGTLALTVHSMARAFDGRSDVRVEPWITVGAAGLLAHAGPASPGETAAQQAERVAETLARAVLSSGPPPAAIVRAREELLSSLGEDPTPGYWLALQQSSASHPSWLEPRGTWESLTNASVNAVQLRRMAFARGRLRVATLGNRNSEQVEAGEARLAALLGPNAGSAECPPATRSRTVAGTYRLETRGSGGPSAVIALSLPSSPAGIPDELLWTEYLLNRTGGWLEQALLAPELVSTARAKAMGGVDATALVIEVRAADGKLEQAVAQVRGLLARLRAGAATDEDAALAERYFARQRAQLSLDPRQRIVQLWHGESAEPGSLRELRRLHQRLLDPEREVIVITTVEP